MNNVLFFLTPKAMCVYLNDDFTLRQALERMEKSGFSVPTVKPWHRDLVFKKIDYAKAHGAKAIAMDIGVAQYQIAQRGDAYVKLDAIIAAEQYGVGFLLGNEELRDQVQATLEEMAADGTLAEISIEWFGEDITTIG